MNAKRAKKLNREYRKAADEIINGDVGVIVDVLKKKITRQKNIIIILGSMLAMTLTSVVFYAINI